MNALLSIALAGVLSGGFVGALATIYTARKKVPHEADAIIVTGAETAVATLERSLAAETRRADRAEAKVCRLEERIESLECRLDTLQAALNEARRELHAIITE